MFPPPDESSSSEQEGVLLTVHEMQWAVDAIKDKNMLTLAMERERRRVLQRELGYDEILVYHVTHLQAIAWTKDNQRIQEAWDVVRTIDPDLPFPHLAALTKCTWMFWFYRESKRELGTQSHTLYLILRTSFEGSFKGRGRKSAPPGEDDVVLGLYPKRSYIPGDMVISLLTNLRAVLAAAHVALENSSASYKDGKRIWNLKGEFEDYWYPWQPAPRQNESILSIIIDHSG